MKTIVKLMLMCLLITSCSDKSNNIENFYNYFEEEQEAVLKETVEYFNWFLNENFKNEKTKEGKIFKFLKYGQKYKEPDKKWKYDIEKNNFLVKRFEETGLRKEIWRYGKEINNSDIDTLVSNYYQRYNDSISKLNKNENLGEIEAIIDEEMESYLPNTKEEDSLIEVQRVQDSIKFSNWRICSFPNKLIVAMHKYPSMDTSINKYTETILKIGDLNPSLLLISLFQFDKRSYSNPYMDIIIIKEIFYFLMERTYVNSNKIYR